MKIQFLIVAILTLVMMSCSKERIKPSSTITSEHRNVSDFHQVIVSGAIEADVIFSSTEEKVVVEANSNIHAYIRTEVLAGVLYIHVKENIQFKKEPTIRVHITALSLDGIQVSGASNFAILNNLVSPILNVEITGASTISGSVIVEDCSIKLSGASNGNLHGNTSNAKMNISGASSIRGTGFSIDDLQINLSGASNAKLQVNDSIDVTASGASTLEYTGNAVITNSDLSGSSSVMKL